MTSLKPISDDLRTLERMDLQALRDAWRLRFGPPPALRSVEMLRRLLAWKIQAAAFGGLDAEARKLLRRTGGPRGPALDEGARLAREWQGVRHEVEEADGGFLYAGARYDSLSEIARQITGVRWNGPRFFGLRRGHRA